MSRHRCENRSCFPESEGWRGSRRRLCVRFRAVHDREQCCIRADAEWEGEYCDAGKAGILHQASTGNSGGLEALRAFGVSVARAEGIRLLPETQAKTGS